MRIFSVIEVNRYLRETLESDVALADVWIAGEISNFVRSAAGHLYFTLKDREGQLKCVFFRNGRQNLAIENGTAVIAHGRISLYEVSGALQFYVNLIQPEGAGLLNLQFEQLKLRLAEEGLFEPERKRPLPRFPQRIGVVTSPTGAVIHDISQVIRRRFPLAEIVLAPALVQGDGAPESVIAALKQLNGRDDIDVIIVGRGGGSLEELWCFNDERVARAIFGSRIPVISAVGHETDYTIADFVADCRAPTPSAAAEMVVPDQSDLRQQVDRLRKDLGTAAADQVMFRRNGMRSLVDQLQRALPSIEPLRQRVDDFTRSLDREMASALELRRERLRSRALQLHSLSPLLTLARGYAVVQWAPLGVPVRSIDQVKVKDRLQIRVSDGTFHAEVVE